MLDWDYRRRAGDDPRPGDYLTRFPGDTTLVEDVGRAMAESAVSTRAWPAEADARPTPWSGDRAPGFEGEAVAGADAGAARYELLQEVGRGGIGVVFRGRDRQLGRELAVKVLREDYRDEPDAWHRFFEEARVGSRLQHPAIVPVYELGLFVDRRPYFTMKLVQGHTLAKLLRDRADPGQELPRLLGIFEQVCQAMAYAHAQGVVHRDLKPANVMVGTFGEVQVMDWGFAKVLAGDRAKDASGSTQTRPVDGWNGVTQSGMVMGTPAYMPPEQARGEAALIDPRADVFALGAILCEVLTGRPPYADGSAEEVCRRAAAGDLGDAHARLDACGAEVALRELAKRCLAAERAARPADAGAVAREVTGYLASAQERLRRAEVERAEAEVRAQEAGAKVRAERRARRLTLALAAALLCGTAVAAWQAVLATGAQHDALAAQQDALAAAAAQTEAKEAADAKEAETRAVLGFVQRRILAAVRPKGREGGLGREVTLRRALEAALQAVDQSFTKQPLTEARLRLTLAESFLDLGEGQIAASQYERARALCTAHLGPDHADTLRSANDLASCYVALGRHGDALKLFEETLALMKVKLGPEHPDTLSCMTNLAVSYADLGRLQDALKLHEQALALQQAILGPDHPHTLHSMHTLASCYADLGRLQDALKLREQALAGRRAKLGPEHPDTLSGMNNLAASYEALGRLQDALKLHEQALALRQAILGPDHPDTLQSMHNLANCHAALGRHPEALKLYEEALALRQANLGPDHPDTLRTAGNLANCYAALGRHADALKLREETLALMKVKLGPEHPDTLTGMNNLAISYAALGRLQDALQLREQALALRQARLGADHPDTLQSLNNLAISYATLGRHADALRLFEETLAHRKARLGPDHPDTLQSMSNLATCYATLGRHADALKLREETLALLRAKLGPGHPETLRSLRAVAESFVQLDRGAEAVPVIDECVRRSAGQVVHPRLIPAVMDLRLRHFEKAKDAPGCRATAEMWEKFQRTDVESLYTAACYRAVTAAVLRATDQSPDAAKEADAEADRAMAWLQKTVAAGYKDVANVKKDADLDALRDRPDFQALLAQLGAGG
jgi:tetratricopeptide (TPR) repeat protein